MRSIAAHERISDNDHPAFDNDSPWPRRLLHVPTMTSYKWRPGNKYNGRREPSYNAISYTWGRWKLNSVSENPGVGSLVIKGIPWEVPRIDPSHFSVEQFESTIRQAVQKPPPQAKLPPPRRLRKWKERLRKSPEFLWLDIACIDQRETPEGKAEIGRQAGIFKGAKAVYIWLSHTSHLDMAYVDQYLRDSATFPNALGLLKTLPEAQEWKVRSSAIQEIITKFVADPWFSSLWTLQEAFLCPGAIFLAKDAQYVNPEGWFLFHLYSLISHLNNIRKISKRALDLQSDTFDWQPIKDLITLIEASGIESLYELNPMAVLTVARFRKTKKDVDRVYGIMQIFGDECRVGEAAAGAQQTAHEYTLSDLQDEFGRLLLHRYPILSQIHTHLEPPPLGKGWRICARSATPIGFHFAVNHRVHDNIKDFAGRPIVSRCRLTTTILHGLTWGCFTGKACEFNVLQQSWSGHYYSSLDTNGVWDGRQWPLNIALDRLPILREILPFYARCQDMQMGEESQHQLAREISLHFREMKLVVLLLGDERTHDFFPEWEDVPSPDMFLGMILLSQTHEGTQYWQRLGICQWTTYLAKHTANHTGLDRDVLFTQGQQWWDLQGVFG
ncbi:hypothetical protein BDW59DRAFT_163866 [Aspergillus cavernicola]|uniref:Heterokaryon incompatibility domain-containing protein n=1 Tax=Aspergillus cavernicola TaxID=176166 RepID=A0ABR4I3F9_9EURO